ncbi:MAG: hypothetical protein GX072_06950, partial [Lysinibacillus sp.]|nr:hypothetical protein [Lysinibacillus sp.]
MARKNARTKTKAKSGMHSLYFEIIGLILIGFAIISFFEYGFVGRMVQSASMFIFGNLH